MNPTEKHPFGDVLRGFRVRAQISRQELAQRLHVHLNTIAHWEVGNILPKKKVKEIAEALGLDDYETRQLLAACQEDTLASARDQQETTQLPAPLFPRIYHFLPPSTHVKQIQQRAEVVRDIYELLVQPTLSAVILTGIAGVGKSTLAALVYQYAEKQRQAQVGPFVTPAIWCRVNPAMTMTAFASILLEALGSTSSGIENLSPNSQALALFAALQSIPTPCLIVIDQFEELIATKPDAAFADNAGFDVWLEAINSAACACRILLTSRLWPQGNSIYRPICMREYIVAGLQVSEGIELLQKEGVEATEQELQMAVQLCSGHPFSLLLLASLTHRHKLKLQDILHNPLYLQFWHGEIAEGLLDAINKRYLNDVQRQLLRAFSIYREPVPLDAALSLTNFPQEVWTPRMLRTTLHALLSLHLLQALGEGRYQPHAIIVDYAWEHFNAHVEQTNQQALCIAHSRAARYYQQVATSSSSGERKRLRDLHPLIEAVWHLCAAGEWQEAYTVMEQEALYSGLHHLGGNVTLLEIYQSMLPLDKWCQERTQHAQIYYYLAEICRVLGRMEESGLYYEKEREVWRELGNSAKEAGVLMNLGWHYYDLGIKLSAKAYHEQAYQLYLSLEDRAGEARACSALGWFYVLSGENERAMLYLTKALKISIAVADRMGEATALARLGSVYDNSGKKEQALITLKQALVIYQELQYPRGEAWQTDHIGKIYAELGHYEQAQMHLASALSIFQEVQDRRGEAWVLSDLGKVFIEMGQDEQAQTSLEQALRIFREVQDSAGEGRALFNTGLLLKKRKQYGQAMAVFLLARDIYANIQHSDAANIQSQITLLHEEIGEQEFAALYANGEQQALLQGE